MWLSDWAWIITFVFWAVIEIYAVSTKGNTLSGSAWRAMKSMPMLLRIMVAVFVLLLIYHLLCPAFLNRGCI